jgi:hypothetical protein
MAESEKFRIKQIAPEYPLTWAATEWFVWNQKLINILKQDVDESLFGAAYGSVNWQKYYERLKGTPFYDWAMEGGGILSFGGPAHIQNNRFFSTIGDITTVEDDYLKSHPEFNQVLHDLHVEAAKEMIDYLFEHSPKIIEGSVVETDSSPFIPLTPGTPQYNFSLNPHRFFGKLTHCPDCECLLESRKLPFLIKIEPNITTVFSIDSHYCPACDWLILEQHKLEGLLAAFCMQQKLQSVIGNEYDVIGTADEAAWQRGMQQGLEFEELAPYTHSFKEIRPLKKRQRQDPQRKGLKLADQSASKKHRPPKSKRLSRRQRKKGRRK